MWAVLNWLQAVCGLTLVGLGVLHFTGAWRFSEASGPWLAAWLAVCYGAVLVMNAARDAVTRPNREG